MPFSLALVRIAVFAALLAGAGSPVERAACALGLMGLFTRPAAWALVALEAGRMGPLVGAAAIMGVAPCADVLAFDAVPDAWRRADARTTAPPSGGLAYALPTWVSAGFGLLPPFVLPLLLVAAPWAQGLRALGRGTFRRPLAIVYDAECGFCRRAIATLRTLDVLGRIDWTPSDDAPRVRALGLVEVAETGELAHFTAVFPGGTVWGYDAYLRLAARVPFFWPLLPLLALPPVVALGRRVYGKVEASRPDINPEPLPMRPPPTWLGTALVGAGVVAWVLYRLVART